MTSLNLKPAASLLVLNSIPRAVPTEELSWMNDVGMTLLCATAFSLLHFGRGAIAKFRQFSACPILPRWRENNDREHFGARIEFPAMQRFGHY
jgi:hypothetical protein